MNDDVAIRLLEAIEANRLAVLFGAGLSMAPPSSLPSAASIANTCATRYDAAIGTAIEASVCGDLERMSKWFLDRGTFESLFIGKLVPWEAFHREPNPGHEAIADFLACGVVCAGITTNFDQLVERAASRLGEPDFRAIVEQADIPVVGGHKPLLKVHGCEQRNRQQTIWCKDQLNTPDIQDRMNRFRTWLATTLLGRDILILGFWSDWAYLTDIITDALTAVGPQSVCLVDPAPAGDLAAKAPSLWAWCNGPDVPFSHVQESAAAFLDELRCRWSHVFVRRLARDATATYQTLFGELPDFSYLDHPLPSASSLYAIRRDLTGVPRNRPVRCRSPQTSDYLAATLHTRLLRLGAGYDDHVYTLNGHTFRVLSGHGELLSVVKDRYHDEPPLPGSLEYVVCAGGILDPTPAHLVRGSESATIVRGGLQGTWITHDEFLGIVGAP